MPDWISVAGTWKQKPLVEESKPVAKKVPELEIKEVEDVETETVGANSTGIKVSKVVKKPITKSKPRGRPKKKGR